LAQAVSRALTGSQLITMSAAPMRGLVQLEQRLAFKRAPHLRLRPGQHGVDALACGSARLLPQDRV
jgi:hypothetical protein